VPNVSNNESKSVGRTTTTTTTIIIIIKPNSTLGT
jgi:hypothetical protein